MRELLNKLEILLTDPCRAFVGVLYRLGFRVQANKHIANLCRGDCVEVGALSSPVVLPNATSILYADVATKEESKVALEKVGYLGYHNRRQDFVDVDIVFRSDQPPLNSLSENSIDCVFSSHSLEHSSNPIAALVDYLRVLKVGGVVYSVIPNKKHTYDNKRKLTEIDKLIEKYLKDDWSYTLEEYRDVFANTDNNIVYDNYTEEDVVRAFNYNDGMHHIYVYDEANVLEMISFVSHKAGAELIYFDSTNQTDIHFALKKIKCS